MQFDELHSRLFALAKKGTRDEHFVVSTESGYGFRRKRIQSKLQDNKKKVPFKDKHYATSHKAAQNLKNLQFTLFD